MDLGTSLLLLARRWIIVVPLLVLTVVSAAYVAFKVVAPQWQSTGSVLLVPPNLPRDPGGAAGTPSNPYLDYGSLDTAAQVLLRVTTDQKTIDRLHKLGATANYDLNTGTGGPGPIINVVATGRTPTEAMHTVEVVSRAIADDFHQRQINAGAPTDTLIRAEVLTSPSEATRQLGSRLRAAGAVGALGLFATVGAAFAVEGLLQRSRQRGQRREAEDGVIATITPQRGQRREVEEGVIVPTTPQRGQRREVEERVIVPTTAMADLEARLALDAQRQRPWATKRVNAGPRTGRPGRRGIDAGVGPSHPAA